MGKFEYLAVGIISGFLGALGGSFFESSLTQLNVAYEKKIDGDERQYLVVESFNGFRTPLVRDTAGEPFKRLDDVSEEGLDSERMRIEKLRERVLSKE